MNCSRSSKLVRPLAGKREGKGMVTDADNAGDSLKDDISDRDSKCEVGHIIDMANRLRQIEIANLRISIRHAFAGEIRPVLLTGKYIVFEIANSYARLMHSAHFLMKFDQIEY